MRNCPVPVNIIWRLWSWAWLTKYRNVSLQKLPLQHHSFDGKNPGTDFRPFRGFDSYQGLAGKDYSSPYILVRRTSLS